MNEDYREIADGLQKDLLEMTTEADSLKEELTKAKVMNASLKDELAGLQKKNKELKSENDFLNTENDKQAVNYVKVRKECDRLKGILKDYGVDLDLEIENNPEKERAFINTVRKKMPEFVRYTDVSSLAPYLFKFQLLTFDEYAHINSLPSSNAQSQYYYTTILPKKGAKAYLTFYQCLLEAVKEPSCNKGHKDLLCYFNDS